MDNEVGRVEEDKVRKTPEEEEDDGYKTPEDDDSRIQQPTSTPPPPMKRSRQFLTTRQHNSPQTRKKVELSPVEFKLEFSNTITTLPNLTSIPETQKK